MTAVSVITFQPSATAPFEFQPTFDGQQYTCYVKWNVAGQRYYVECYSLTGVLIFNVPLIGSPNGYDISMTGGYFTTKLVYRANNGQFEVIN